MSKNQEKNEKLEKVIVRPVVCEKCKKKDFILFRRVNDNAQYVLKCKGCMYAVEFRMVVSWRADIVKENIKDKR